MVLFRFVLMSPPQADSRRK